ncbi:MAG: DJ-1/PfpI family protein [Pseudomonadota bacterium]
MDRRKVLAGMSASAVLAPFLTLHNALAAQGGQAAQGADADTAHGDLSDLPDLKMMGTERVAMVMFPGFTALDLVGPHYFFACMMGARVDLLTTGGDLAPVASDLGLAIAPDTELAKASEQYDLLFVPGGTAGVIAAMKDEALLGFLRDQSANARYTTSVCTGSAVLGQAGLLRLRRATSHWAILDTLGAFGAIPTQERVVRDGPIITGAGVSAGLDLALEIVADLRGKDYARALTLQAEYAPQPPFADGSLKQANPQVAHAMSGMFQGFSDEVRALAQPAPSLGNT